MRCSRLSLVHVLVRVLTEGEEKEWGRRSKSYFRERGEYSEWLGVGEGLGWSH
jgi:hypothetical protein